MICLNIKCKKEHDGSFGSGKYCSRNCANSRIRTEEIKNKISNKLKGILKNKKFILIQTEELCEYGCGLKANYKLIKHNTLCCLPHYYQCLNVKDKKQKDKRILNSSIVKTKNFRKKGWNEVKDRERRRRVLEEQNFHCQICKLNKWLDKNIVLEIDHIDGNRQNNTRENLRAICPNCHSQTETYKSKNKKSNIKTQDFINAVLESNSISEACKLLNIAPMPFYYKKINKLIIKYKLEFKNVL